MNQDEAEEFRQSEKERLHAEAVRKIEAKKGKK
jgi:hypothetical protein